MNGEVALVVPQSMLSVGLPSASTMLDGELIGRLRQRLDLEVGAAEILVLAVSRYPTGRSAC